MQATTIAARFTASNAALDHVLTQQLVVAWAGEDGDPPRLKWWRTELVSEFGGKDLFRRLLPHTWQWAVLEGAREAARRRDAERRNQDADSDRLVTLYRLGFDVDEHVDQRLIDLKRAGRAPTDALPGLRDVVVNEWSKSAFNDWVMGHGDVAATTVPAGRRLTGEPPASLELLVNKLVAALNPLADTYPMPHYRKTG